VFTAPRFSPDSKLEKPAIVTVLHNGILVHHNTAFWGPTRHRSILPYAPDMAKGPIALQDHGNPVRYRNIWIRPLTNYDGAAYPPAVTVAEFVFETAPFASAHASTLVETRDGLVAAWFGGTREGASDVGIWLSRRQGKVNGTWTQPVQVATGIQPDGTQYPCWNPVLFEMPEKVLALFYKVGPNPQSWWGMVRTSRDEGRTWSSARRLPDGILGPIKNKPVRLPDGTLLAPSSTESPEKPSTWRVHFERTVDTLTWTTSRPPVSADGTHIDAIQPSILIHPGGRLQAVGRTRSSRIFESWSSDGGKTWSPIALTALPNPNAGIDAVTLRDGRHLLVYNHTAQGRTPLNVAISRDGTTWDEALVLERDPGEYSYPAVIQTSDGLVHITYTWKRQRIKHVAIDATKLILH
jgi:predicted neuraminidase